MSLYHSVPGVPGTVSGDGGISTAGLLSGDLSGMLDGSANGMMNGLDMDVNLRMDMDLDMSQEAHNYNALALPQQTSSAGSQGADPPMLSSNGTYNPRTQSQDTTMTGAGAGPLPTSFGVPAPTNSSTLTEFTKRRNWSQRIIEELKDFLHILSPDGRILWVSPSCKAITGYEPKTLIDRFIFDFVHPDDSGIFIREFNESIASGNSLRFFYRFKKDDGTYTIFECDGHAHISSDPGNTASMNASSNAGIQMAGQCRGFFMMARPYPTKNAALLDSLLEHKIENERLMKRIEELKREEAEENAEQERIYRDHVTSPHEATPSEPQVVKIEAASDPAASTQNYQGMPPPAKPSVSNTALTRQNLDSALSAQKPDSIADKMSRYEASSTHLESIELMTGLRYRDGERSHGISTGDTSPALIRGDAGIAILLDRDRDGPKKDKKKLKVADEYVCADCGTLDSPEWRKGPKGPKTLCNACGLRWAKKEKKRSGDDGKANSPIGGVNAPPPGAKPPGAAPNAGTGGAPQPSSLPMHASTGGSQ